MTALEARVDQTLALLIETATEQVAALESQVKQTSAWEDVTDQHVKDVEAKWMRRPNWPGNRSRYERACWKHARAVAAFNDASRLLKRARRRLQDLQQPHERDRRIHTAERAQELRAAAHTGELLS